MNIIEVSLRDDGNTDYRLHPTSLNTRAYGIILATLATQIAAMFKLEDKMMDHDKVLAQIVHHFNKELEEPTATVTGNLLQ